MVNDLAGSGVSFTAILTGKTLNDGDNVFLTGYPGYSCSEVSVFSSTGDQLLEANLKNTNTTTGEITINVGLIAPKTNCEIHCIVSKI